MAFDEKRAGRLVVVGVTGVVGREVMAALEQVGYPSEKITALASERSEGEEVEYREETLPVEKPDAHAFRGAAAVILATPSAVSKQLALDAQRQGAWVVDTSPAFRSSVPLVLPGINDSVLERPFEGRVVAIPSASTAGL